LPEPLGQEDQDWVGDDFAWINTAIQERMLTEVRHRVEVEIERGPCEEVCGDLRVPVRGLGLVKGRLRI
jgi:hypothetical protein